MKLIIGLALVINLVLAFPVVVRAQTIEQISCTNAISEVASTASLMPDADNNTADLVLTQYNSTKGDLAGCTGKESRYDYAQAMMTLIHAWLQHHSGDGAADHTLELAIQRLTKCTSHYYGADTGATCAQWQKRAIAWQVGPWPQ